MIIERDQIRLIQLSFEHIELVRQKRNSPEIQSTMQYREYISPEMQVTWFNKINNINNNYFIIQIREEYVGLIYGADIDWKNGITNNGGIFIWNEQYLASHFLVQASILLTDFGFYFGMRKNFIKILKHNKRAISFNLALGYKLLPEQEEEDNQMYELTADRYFNATHNVRRLLDLSDDIKLTLTSHNYNAYKSIFKNKRYEGMYENGQLVGMLENKFINLELVEI